MVFCFLEKEQMIEHYKFLSKLTCLINGTFVSPVLTLFFFITGRIQPLWLNTTEMTDSHDNKISMGSVISFSLGWIIKACPLYYDLNQ